MLPVIIGISSGLLVILIIALLKQVDKPTIFGLVLSGIGFLYVGFTWSDTRALIITCIQAIVFLFIAWDGIRRSLYVLAAGYFLHGSWDLLYNLFPETNLIPPHYDLFCLSIDFTIGFYLLFIKYGNTKKSLIRRVAK
jgi:hypothetical protein